MRDPEEIIGWLKKAEDGYQGALDLSRRRKYPLPNLVCFHCQQSAEKYLKALLILEEISFPKTHDLLALLTLLQDAYPDLVLYREWLEILNPYSVQFRYPGDETSLEDSRLALQTIKKFRKTIFPFFPRELRNKLR